MDQNPSGKMTQQVLTACFLARVSVTCRSCGLPLFAVAIDLSCPVGLRSRPNPSNLNEAEPPIAPNHAPI